MEEKRRLLNFVFSNSTWKNGKLIPAYRNPFDLLALTNTAYQKEKAASSKKDGLFEIWLPGQDSVTTVETFCFSLRNLPFGFLTQRIRSILILKGFVKRISLPKQVLLFWHETNA